MSIVVRNVVTSVMSEIVAGKDAGFGRPVDAMFNSVSEVGIDNATGKLIVK